MIVILAESYTDAWNYCRGHHFSQRDVYLVCNLNDTIRLQSVEAKSLIRTPKFLEKHSKEVDEMFSKALERLK